MKQQTSFNIQQEFLETLELLGCRNMMVAHSCVAGITWQTRLKTVL